MTDTREIVDEIVKTKSHVIKEFLDKLGKIKIEPVDIEKLEKQEQEQFKIKTGTIIDEMIGGGVPEGKSVMLYGEFGSGKTQTCFTTVCLAKGYIIYIDTEGSFSCQRLKQICESRKIDWNDVKKRIILYTAENWIQQMYILQSLPSPSDVNGKVDLIICDSYSKHFRGIEFVGRETLQLKNGFIREFIFSLERLAKQHRAALIYTTQIYDEPKASPYATKADTQKPVGGHSAEHQPDFILFFRRGTGNVRIVRMVDSSYTALSERAFLITEKGIEDLPPDTKISKTLEPQIEKFETKQHQEEIKIKKKEKSQDQENKDSEEEIVDEAVM